MNAKLHPVISVVMASYNSEKYISEALDSILSQSFGDFEVIVIDDSTDSTADVVKEYSDSRIRLTKNKKKVGISNARNMGIAKARGEFIAFHDADDVSLPGRFRKQIDFFRQNPDVAMLGGQVEISHAGERRENVSKRKIVPDFDGLMKENCFATSSVMVRATVLRDVGGFNPIIECAEDWELWIRIAKKYKTTNLPDTLFVYRVTPGGITDREQQNFGLWNALVVEIANGSISDEVFNLVAREGISSFEPYMSIPARIRFHQECYHYDKNVQKYKSALHHCIALHDLHGFDWRNTKNLSKPN